MMEVDGIIQAVAASSFFSRLAICTPNAPR